MAAYELFVVSLGTYVLFMIPAVLKAGVVLSRSSKTNGRCSDWFLRARKVPPNGRRAA